MARRLPSLIRNVPWVSSTRIPLIRSVAVVQQRTFYSLQQTVCTPTVCTHELIGRRFYAKGKNKGKDEGKKGAGPKVSLTSDELNSVVKYDKMLEAFQHVLEQLQRDYMTKLSLRTNAASFDQLPIETNDGAFPLIQLGQLAQKSPTLVVVNLAGFPQYIPDVKSAFMSIGINPSQEGNSLIVPIPKVTREQRQNMASTAKMMCNKSKDKLRDVQNSFLRDVKKQKGKQSDDLIQSVHDYIQKDAHDYQAKAEGLLATKQKELLNS